MRAQTNMVFTFILVAVIIGLVVIFGGLGIQKILKSSNEVATMNLIDKITKDIGSLERMRGSSEIFTYKMPSNIDELCFVGNVKNGIYSNYFAEDLFLKKGNLIVEASDVGNVKLSNPVCQKAIGPISFKITGNGDSVGIEPRSRGGTMTAVDEDHDGIPDSYELYVYEDLTSINENSDTDGDGKRDKDELEEDTDPEDPGDH